MYYKKAFIFCIFLTFTYTFNCYTQEITWKNLIHIESSDYIIAYKPENSKFSYIIGFSCSQKIHIKINQLDTSISNKNKDSVIFFVKLDQNLKILKAEILCKFSIDIEYIPFNVIYWGSYCFFHIDHNENILISCHDINSLIFSNTTITNKSSTSNLIKISPELNVIWNKSLSVNAIQIKSDEDGSIYCAGNGKNKIIYDKDTFKGGNVFLLKTDSSGNLLFGRGAKVYGQGGGFSGLVMNLEQLEISNKAIYISGRFIGDSIRIAPNISTKSYVNRQGQFSVFVAKYLKNGHPHSVNSGGGIQDDFVYSLAIDDYENAYLTGETFSGKFYFEDSYIEGNDFQLNYWTTCLDTQLNTKWLLGGRGCSGGYRIDVNKNDLISSGWFGCRDSFHFDQSEVYLKSHPDSAKRFFGILSKNDKSTKKLLYPLKYAPMMLFFFDEVNFSDSNTISCIGYSNLKFQKDHFEYYWSEKMYYEENVLCDFYTEQYDLDTLCNHYIFGDLKLSQKLGQTNKTDQNNNIWIYPNPTSNILNISLEENIKQSVLVEIINAQGKLFHKENMSSKSYKIDLTDYPLGVYFVIIQLNNKTIKKKFIKL